MTVTKEVCSEDLSPHLARIRNKGRSVLPLRPKLKTTHHQVEIRGDDAIALNSYAGTLSQIITNLVMNSLTPAYSLEDCSCS